MNTFKTPKKISPVQWGTALLAFIMAGTGLIFICLGIWGFIINVIGQSLM